MKRILIQLLIFSIVILLVFLLFNFEEYFADHLQAMTDNKIEYSILSFVLLVSDILLPVPSSIVMYSNGFVLGVVNGFLLSMFSVTILAILGYLLGMLATNRLGLTISPEANGLFVRYGYLAIFLTRGVPILAESVSLVCGYNRVVFRQYLSLNILGYLPVCFTFSFCGHMGSNGNFFLLSFFFALILSGLFWIFGKSAVVKQGEADNE